MSVRRLARQRRCEPIEAKLGCDERAWLYPCDMCNRYETPEEREIERTWHVGRDQPGRWWDEVVFPRGKGVFIRRAAHDVGYRRELVAGQWGLIPWFAKAAKLHSTNNARSEDWQRRQHSSSPGPVASAASFRPGRLMSPAGRLARTSGGASGGPTVSHGDWLDYGTPGSTNPPAKFTRATPCSPSTPIITR